MTVDKLIRVIDLFEVHVFHRKYSTLQIVFHGSQHKRVFSWPWPVTSGNRQAQGFINLSESKHRPPCWKCSVYDTLIQLTWSTAVPLDWEFIAYFSSREKSGVTIRLLPLHNDFIAGETRFSGFWTCLNFHCLIVYYRSFNQRKRKISWPNTWLALAVWAVSWIRSLLRFPGCGSPQKWKHK